MTRPARERGERGVHPEYSLEDASGNEIARVEMEFASDAVEHLAALLIY